MTTLLRSAILFLAVLGGSTTVAAQSAAGDSPMEVVAPRGLFSRAVPDTATTVLMGSASLGPRRAASSNLDPMRFERERKLTEVRMRVRPRTVGALIGGGLGGAIGFAAGYEIDNIERPGGARLGSATLIGTAGGVFVGALLGGAVGWLVER